MKVYLINDTSKTPNWGCRATTLALRSLIEAAGGTITDTLYLDRLLSFDLGARRSTRLAKARIDPWIPRRPIVRELARRMFQKTRHLFPDVVPKRWSDTPRAADAMLRHEILEAEFEALMRADAVVINGEGGIYDRQRKGRMMVFLAYVSKARLGKPTFMVNHTADLGDPVMREMVEQVYPLLDDVVYREPLSAEECRAFCPGTVAADAAFVYDPSPLTAWAAAASRPGYFDVWPDRATNFDPRRPYICLGGSSIYLRSDRPAYDPVPGFVALARRLASEFGQVVLTASDLPDERIFRAVAASLDLPLIAVTTPVQQAVDVLGNARAYIGGRWHPSIFALTGGTPVVTLTSSTFKTQGLALQAGLDGPTFDALDLEGACEPIADLVRTFLNQGEELRDRLRQVSRSLRRQTRAHVQGLERLARELVA